VGLTLPAAALVAGLVWELADAVGSGATGSVVMAVLAPRGRRAVPRHPAPGRGHVGGRRMTLAAIVDTAALWKIVVAVFAVGVPATAVFGQGAMALARIERARREGGGAGARRRRRRAHRARLRRRARGRLYRDDAQIAPASCSISPVDTARAGLV
jgi:hypothetical protein